MTIQSERRVLGNDLRTSTDARLSPCQDRILVGQWRQDLVDWRGSCNTNSMRAGNYSGNGGGNVRGAKVT